jgi:SAM-dependent methyltransferase
MESYRQRLYQHYTAVEISDPAAVGADPLNFRAAYLQDLIRRHFPPDKDGAILDLGCGHGAMLHFARQAGYHNTVGVDRSEAQVAEASRRGITGIIAGDLYRVLESFSPESQDVVIAFDIIEHFTKDELLGCLDQVWRVLKTGGKLIIHTPNGASPFCGRIRYGDFTHELAMTRESLTQLCQVCGFSQISCYEEQPVFHGIISGIRWLLWKAIRCVLRLYIAVETGVVDRGMIFTQNMLCIVTK